MKQDKTEKAFNYSEFIQFEQLLRGLVNIANEQRKGVLAERLAILLHEKFEKGQEEESEEDSEEITKVKEEEDEEYDDETEEKENYPPKRGHSTQSISPTQVSSKTRCVLKLVGTCWWNIQKFQWIQRFSRKW